MLILYFVVFSIGEAIWASRFMEYSAEIAPEGLVAQYMGVANLPWFVAKFTTGFYSGFVLEKFVPKDGPQKSRHDVADLWGDRDGEPDSADRGAEVAPRRNARKSRSLILVDG